MLRPRAIPCLLLANGALVKTVKFRNPSYVGDPINTVRIFNEKEVDEVLFLDILATRNGREPALDLIRDLASECFMPFGYGGGITRLQQVEQVLRLGAEKVSINAQAIANPQLITDAASEFGSQAIVASIDARPTWLRGYRVFTHGGRKRTSWHPVALAKRLEEAGAGEILITSIKQDGTMEGYDLHLTREVATAVSIPVIACGGAGRLEDFGRAVKTAGASAVASGSMVVYQGRNRAVLINFPTTEELESVLN